MNLISIKSVVFHFFQLYAVASEVLPLTVIVNVGPEAKPAQREPQPVFSR